MNAKENGRAYERVIDYVKREIMCGQIKLGEKLIPERELAEKLGVSRTSVREGMRLLENIGIITSKQGAGNAISCNFEKSLGEALSMLFLMQQIDYRQISELRHGLEETAIVLAVERITKDEVDELEKIVFRMAEAEQEAVRAEYDKKLHYLIISAAKNQLILSILDVLSAVMDQFIKDLRLEIFKWDKGENKLQQTHVRMVECLKNGDKISAREAVAEHFKLIDESLAVHNKKMS